MAATPNLNEMKEVAGIDKLADAFKLLITHDKTEEEGFLMRIGEESAQLRAVMEKREQTHDEADTFGQFHLVATAGHDCLFEIQMRDQRKLDLLAQLLILAREGVEEKEEHLERMEEAELFDDE